MAAAAGEWQATPPPRSEKRRSRLRGKPPFRAVGNASSLPRAADFLPAGIEYEWEKVLPETRQAERRAHEHAEGVSAGRLSRAGGATSGVGDAVAVLNWLVLVPIMLVLLFKTLRLRPATPPGFGNAPVTRGAIALTTCASVLAIMGGANTTLTLHWWDIGAATLAWRILTFQLHFANWWHLVVGVALLYHFRQFERQWGARKYAAFLLVSTAVSSLISLGLLVVGRDGASLPGEVARPGPF